MEKELHSFKAFLCLVANVPSDRFSRRYNRLAVFLSLLFFCLNVQALYSQAPAKKPGKSTLIYDGTNYYHLFKPADSTTGVHPIIFCSNGAGELGTTNSAYRSVGDYCKGGASMQFPNAAKGGYSTFFVLEIHDVNSGGIIPKLPTAMAYAKTTLGSLLDTTQMYFMGLSLTGDVAGLIAKDSLGLAKRFAGVLGCSPVYSVDGGVIFNGLASAHLFGVWVDANNDNNNNTNWVMQQYAQYNITGYTGTPTPKLYIPNGAAAAARYSDGNYGGHYGGWVFGMDTLTRIWDLDSSKFPGHTTTNTPLTVTNIYEQFLGYKRTYSGTNISPVANGGADRMIVLPTSSTTLDGSASYDSDGTIVSYQWTKILGGSATITSSTAATTTVAGLTSGHYSFKLQVTDNGGATSSDTVLIYVNQKPTATIAVNPITIVLPVDSVLLNGTGSTDDDGIQSYAWSKVSGPGSPSIITPTASSTKVKSLVAGTYTFRLIVTDWGGLKDTAQVTVNVNSSANTAPVANAGPDKYIVLPTNSFTLDGTASSDPDGTITAYQWTKLSGGAATITSSTSSSTTVTGLTSGHYYFVLQVTDNGGLSAKDTMHIYVNQKPVAVIAGNPITTAADSVTLNGSGSTDDDGIQSYAWSKVSGPGTQTMVSPSASLTVVRNLSSTSTYVFRLIVTDYGGAKDTSQVTVNVTGSGGRIGLIETSGNSNNINPITTAPLPKFSVYPNPTQNYGVLEFVTTENGTNQIQLYSSIGQLVGNYLWPVTKGKNNFVLNKLADLQRGIYIIQVKDKVGVIKGKLKLVKL